MGRKRYTAEQLIGMMRQADQAGLLITYQAVRLSTGFSNHMRAGVLPASKVRVSSLLPEQAPEL